MALKFIISGVALFNFSFAGFAQIKQALNNNTNLPGNRAIGTTNDEFANSGCWCYLDDTHGKGRGKPLDEKDALCRTLHHNYECMIMEEVCEPFGKPWEIPYHEIGLDYDGILGAANNKHRTLEYVMAACERVYDNNLCHQKICKIEMSFIKQMFSVKESELGTQEFIHQNGFDPLTDERCSIESGYESEKDCCGEYPNRFPYKIEARDGSTRKCCGGKTYNHGMYACCDDQIETVGTCQND